MNDRPDALELIRSANHTLVSEILLNAKPDQLYALRMIANALGIAARELESHDRDTAAETRGLDTLYGKAEAYTELRARNQQFVLDIRRGAFETSRARELELRQHLLVTARAKLAVAYPKALAQSVKNTI